MDKSINSLSFRANLVTNMKGRHNIMKPVAERFAEMTKNKSGELVLSRDGLNYPGALVISLKNNSYILHDYADLLGNNFASASDIKSPVINRIAKTFARIFKALNADNEFSMSKEFYTEKIKYAYKELRNDKRFLTEARNAGDVKNAEAFEKLVANDKKRITALENDFTIIKEKYISQLEKMADKEPKLKVWRDVITDDLLNR